MFYIGLDLGQRRDHTAIAVVERREVRRAYLAPIYPYVDVRGLERVPLGTSYTGVVERVSEVTMLAEISGQCCLVVDGTGVGAPVVDLLRAARLGCEICAVTITGSGPANGNRQTGGTSPGVQRWSVPKQDLLGGVQALLEKGELRIARRMRETGQLIREMTDMRMTMKSSGRVRLGADGCGEHDDLAIALALACWRAGRGKNHFGEGRLPGI
jgi:hypothetical protein